MKLIMTTMLLIFGMSACKSTGTNSKAVSHENHFAVGTSWIEGSLNTFDSAETILDKIGNSIRRLRQGAIDTQLEVLNHYQDLLLSMAKTLEQMVMIMNEGLTLAQGRSVRYVQKSSLEATQLLVQQCLKIIKTSSLENLLRIMDEDDEISERSLASLYDDLDMLAGHFARIKTDLNGWIASPCPPGVGCQAPTPCQGSGCPESSLSGFLAPEISEGLYAKESGTGCDGFDLTIKGALDRVTGIVLGCHETGQLLDTSCDGNRCQGGGAHIEVGENGRLFVTLQNNLAIYKFFACANGKTLLGACWYLARYNYSCARECQVRGLSFDSKTISLVGTQEGANNCSEVASMFGANGRETEPSNCFAESTGLGCFKRGNPAEFTKVCYPANADAHDGSAHRVCACK